MMIQKTWQIIALFVATVGLQANARMQEVVPGEFLVKVRGERFQTISQQALSQMLQAEVVGPVSEESGAWLVRRPVGERVSFAVEQLSSRPGVELVEPNYVFRLVGSATSRPNDPQLGRLWGLVNEGQKTLGDAGEVLGKKGIDIDALRAWAIKKGSQNVIIASIDTGVDYNQADLKENMWVNEAEAQGTKGVDDDKNGFVDDVYGYDFANMDGDPIDDQGHGTHTSGTIAARGDNGTDIAGVTWNAQIMAVKFLSSDGGGTLDAAIKAIDYTTKMGAHMTSNSWGGGGFSKLLYESIERAKAAGILFIAAAGNSGDNNDASPQYPASYDLDNIISVAAIDASGQLASFSCYGRTSVDIAAPGVNIVSITPKGIDSWSGTSMATPHVTGVAALLKSAEPDLTYAEIRERLLSTARPLASLRGRVATAGLVNAYHALTNTKPAADPNDPYVWQKKPVSVSSPHPYADKYSQTWKVSVAGAKQIAIYFSKFETELGYDKVTIKDSKGSVVAVLSGNRSETFSPVIEGDSATITMTSDSSTTGYGFDVEAIAYQ